MDKETESDFQRLTTETIHRMDSRLATLEEDDGKHIWKGNTYAGLFEKLFPDWREGFQSTASFALASPALQDKDNRYVPNFRAFSIKLHAVEGEKDLKYHFVFPNDQSPMVVLFDNDDDSKEILPVNKTETLDQILTILDVLPDYTFHLN